MSMYGPPGGPYPGQPQDPWQGGQQPQDPYGAPADPYGQSWGQQPTEPWGGQPGSGQPGSGQPASGQPYGQPASGQPYGQPQYDPGYAQPQYGQQPGYDPGQYGTAPPYGEQAWAGTPPPKKRGSGPLIALVVVLALLVCAGGATGLYLVTRNNDKKDTVTPRSSASASSSPSAEPTSPSPSPVSTSGSDARTAKVGDCLVNDGSNDTPKLRRVACTAGTFEVLKRFDGTADTSKCSTVTGYTHHYYYKSTDEAQNFVLCMKMK